MIMNLLNDRTAETRTAGAEASQSGCIGAETAGGKTCIVRHRMQMMSGVNKKILDKSPTTPIGRGLMKTPRRGLKTTLCKIFEKNQTFYFYNNRFKILILRHSCSKKNQFQDQTICGFYFKYKRNMFKIFVNRLKEVQRKTTILFCIFISTDYGANHSHWNCQTFRVARAEPEV